MSFLILPAIDVRGGKGVRLRQGRFDEETIYSADPVALAERWREEGAAYLHVVDLDGAVQGRPAQLETVRRMAAAFRGPVEVGGGIRTDDDIRAVLDAGVSRVILGTRACSSPGQIVKLVAEYGPRLAVGIDARDGRVQIAGWVETASMTAVELAQRMDQAGVHTLMVTDTARDGMLSGPNVASLAEIAAAVSCQVIASGGVSSPEDVKQLRACGFSNLSGAIVGKALYEGKTTLAALMKAAR